LEQKKNFATYDLIAKAPGLISFFSFAIGIYALICESLNTKTVSATLLILGVIGLYISFYESKKETYFQIGNKLTDLFNDLKRLSGSVKAVSTPTKEQLNSLEEIEKKYTQVSSAHQIMFSNWYAHYKFFWEQQIEWIDEQKKFRFWRDKIPLSLTLAVVSIAVIVALCFNKINIVYCNWTLY